MSETETDPVTDELVQAACAAYNEIEDSAWDPAMRAALSAALPAAIRAAGEAEREACAKKLEDFRAGLKGWTAEAFDALSRAARMLRGFDPHGDSVNET